MNRAGRKSLMLNAISRHDRLHPLGCLTTPQLAKKAGLKSSSEVVKMLREIEMNGVIKEVSIEPKFGAGYTVRAWQMVKFNQMVLPDEYIVINGKSYRRDGKDDNYVAL